jgi:hypothetical protein
MTRHYWVVSPNVQHDGKNGWKKIILDNGVAIMGWKPDDNNKGYGRGPRFAGKGNPSVQPNDVILIAHGHKPIKLVAVGVVSQEYWIDTYPDLRDSPVQIRRLIPFKRLYEPPSDIPLGRAIPWQAAMKEIDPALEEVCEWLEDELENLDTGDDPATERLKAKYGSGGEGPDHRRLKKWCANHPEELGLSGVISVPGITEYAPCQYTADLTDVAFQMRRGRHAVIEVETTYAKPGAFQALKYKTLLCARLGYPVGDDRVQAILVAWKIPEDVRVFCDEYEIEYKEKRV